MKRSDVLYRVLFVLFVTVVLIVFLVPQNVLDQYEMFFLWIIMPFMGILWFRAYLDGMKGN